MHILWLWQPQRILQEFYPNPLRWRHNGRDSVSNHQPHHYLLNRLFWRRSKKTSKLRVTGLCVGYSPGTGEFPEQMASNAENVSIWWRHHALRSRLANLIISLVMKYKNCMKTKHNTRTVSRNSMKQIIIYTVDSMMNIYIHCRYRLIQHALTK